MSNSGDLQFGGLCYNGHDVPKGAIYCSICGAMTTADKPSPPPPGYPTAPVYQSTSQYPYPAPPPVPYPGAPGGSYPPGTHVTHVNIGGYPAPPGYPYPPVYARPPRPTNGLAIGSMILGILWLYWVGSILAVIMGHIALHQIKRRGESGEGMAIAGLVLGYLGIATFVLLLILGAAIVGSG